MVARASSPRSGLRAIGLAVVCSLTAAAEQRPSHYTCDQVKRTIRPKIIRDKSGVCADRRRGNPWPMSVELPSWDRGCDLNDERFGKRCPALLPATPLRQPTSHNRDHAFGERLRYGTCAVVGSGGSLLGSACGAEIDAHEMVVRTNAPRTDEPYAADVGNRTTLMAINSMLSQGIAGMRGHGHWRVVHDEKDPGHNRPIDIRGKDILSFSSDETIEELGRRQNEIRDALGVGRIFAYTDEFKWGMGDWTRRFYEGEGEVSKGMFTVFIMLLMCDQLDVYGYSDELPGQPYHCTPHPHHPHTCDS